MTKSVLFICMGNVCRSAASEGGRKKIAKERGVNSIIDSPGIIGYHAGGRADSRMIQRSFARGYRLDSISRQVKKSDFDKFDLIIAMDNANVKGLKSLVGDNIDYLNKISMLTDYCTNNFLKEHNFPKEVPDPYYGGSAGFEYVLDMLEDTADGIIEKIK